jgi:hypothetical protein
MAAKFVFQGSRLRLSTDFDGGGLAKVVEAGPDVLDCWPYLEDEYRDGFISLRSLDGAGDQRDGANYSFLFRLDGCLNRKITLRIHVVHEKCKSDDVSVVYANPDFPVISHDGDNWERTPHKRLLGGDGLTDEKIIEVEYTCSQDTVWVSYQYPYTNDRLHRFVQRLADSPFCQVGVAGRSTEGRDIPLISLTDPAVPLRAKPVAWFTGLQHCAELAAGWGFEGMAEFLVSAAPLAVEARRRYEFKFIPIVNVDAVAEGRGRIHRSGRNLNREWERPDPVCDVGTIRQTLEAWRAQGHPVSTFVDLHGFSTVDGRWFAPVLPPENFSADQVRRYEQLLAAIRRQLPGMQYDPFPSVGFAAGASVRTYGALGLSIDGWIYKGPAPAAPDLSSYYTSGRQVLPLAEIKAAGARIVQAWVDFAGSQEREL